MEEQEKYGKEPKYKVGQRVKFIIANYKEPHIGWIYAYYENGNYRVIEDGVTPSGGFNSFVIPEEDITPIVEDYEVSYIAEMPKHYEMAIEPLEFAMKNNLGICEFNILKYICRHRRKNGKEDLLKAKVYLDRLIQFEYPDLEYQD